MELPGGLPGEDGRLRRDYRCKAVTGELERALVDSGLETETLPQQATRMLACGLAELAGRPVDQARVRSLSAGDRAFLVLQLAALIDDAPRWITAGCQGCDRLIQFQISPQDLPFKPAGEGYPATELTLSIGRVSIRVPCGADEEFIATHGLAGSGERLMLSRLLDANTRPVDVNRLDTEDLARLDRLLDEMSPQAGLSAAVSCPHCKLEQQVRVDPYAWLVQEGASLDREIHTLAWHYHWSETDILRLPRERRARYLQLIDQTLGRYGAEDLIQGVNGGRW